jgi:hypothetical protein
MSGRAGELQLVHEEAEPVCQRFVIDMHRNGSGTTRQA